MLFLHCRHPAKFESLQHVICLGTISCLAKLWHLPLLVPISLLLILYWQNCNSIRPADKHASRMTLERYDVESCGERLTVRELSLGRSPGVFTPLLFVRKPEFLINSCECLGSASISIRAGAFPNGGTIHRITRFRNRTSHESRSCGLGPNVATCFTSKCLVKSSLNSAI